MEVLTFCRVMSITPPLMPWSRFHISLDRLCQITLKHWRLPLDANLQFKGKHEGEFCKQLRSIALLASTDNEAVFC